MSKLRSPDEITRIFNQTLNSMVQKLEKKSRREEELANLDRLKKRLTIIRSFMGAMSVVSAASPFFIEFADRILEQNQEIRDNFFLNLDVKAEYLKRHQRQILSDCEFVTALADSIKYHYRCSTAQEKQEIYAEVRILLDCVIEFKIHNPD